MSRALYRDTLNGKVSGVCAGLANYFGLEVWIVRILFISAAVLGGLFLVLLAYVAMTFMLDKQPREYAQSVKEKQDHVLKSKPWQKGQTPADLIDTLAGDFDKMESQLRNIEAYVTSEAFKVDREFSKL
ncbi:envelope stress response membrane protein PspC [Vibrio sp. S4M6]|uniref:envelope stress response membrane protein PspC n=1 Tax=Vibrio sinus TaxID=2946865 RepID=UPI002029B58D|nr:envelope stress response membrane protein PspC [Vibrio sinus]MCL9782055.1 envelope stress response membrane protein PspC [Vibrio sinus]